MVDSISSGPYGWVTQAGIVIVIVISSYFREFDRLRDVSLQFQLGNLYIHVYT